VPATHPTRSRRLAEIAGAFARFGAGMALDRARGWRGVEGGAPPDLGAESFRAGERGAVRLRRMLESLGASFVKIGQLLALHADELPPAYREELSRLLDSTSPLPFAAVAAVLAEELGAGWRERFATFAEEPLASASIGQVHRAVLADGREVAVKVQRPGARELFAHDFALLRGLLRRGRLHVLLAVEPEQLASIVEDIEEFTRAELDYRQEAEACRRFGELPLPGVVVPEVVDELVTGRVLVTTFLDGITLNEVLAHREDPSWLAERGIDRHEVARRIFRTQLLQSLQHGLFQADPHPANVLVLRDGRLGYVDFGIVGELHQRVRSDIVDLVIHELMDDFEGLWPILFRYGRPTAETDVRAFQAEYRALSERFKTSAGKGFARRSLGVLVEEQLRLYHRHRLSVAPGWATYMRCVVVYGTTLAALSDRLDFNREALPIYLEIKARQVWAAWASHDPLGTENPWASPFVRHGYEVLRVGRSLATLVERAAAGELPVLAEEHPRLERMRNLRLRAGVWGALAVTAAWAGVTLLVAEQAVPAALAGLALAIATWKAARALRRLR
jgi:ubiquinone biosynthesis protein